MLRRDATSGTDSGATAILVAASMFLLVGIAAVVLDAGAAFVERRADQTAVDVGAIAGAVEVLIGASGGGVSDDDMVASALDYVRQNLPSDYTDGEWQTLWEGCVDPPADRNTEPGDNFVAMSPPSGWNVSQPNDWCVSRDAAKSLFRVRTPDQLVPTTFARLLGFNSLNTHASAVVNILPAGAGILPFGLPSGANDGTQHCLSSAPTGLADDPCTGPDAGNFGVLKARLFDPSPYNGCNASPLGSVLALNIAAGIDHVIVPDSDGDPSNEIRDYCYNGNVDTLNTDTGFPQGVEWGLASGAGLPGGEIALLRQGPQIQRNVAGNQLDDAPLWDWLLTSGVDYGTDAPLFCDPLGFTSIQYNFGTGLVSEYDFDGDGNDDALASWQHMSKCLEEYVSGGYSAVIFHPDLGDRDSTDWSPRFAYVPQFYESTLGPGNRWNHIRRFRAVFIEGTWWRKGNTWRIHYPGEMCAPCGGSGFGLWQVSAWIIPDSALPSDLRGDPPGAALGVNPFTIELVR